MSAQIDKEKALAIAKKLNGVAVKGKRPHKTLNIYSEGKWLTSISIRQSPKKGQPHDHIPGQLYCSPHFCKELAICNKTREDWIKIITEAGNV